MTEQSAMQKPVTPSIVLASTSEQGEQSLYPPVIEQISHVGHFFYRIIHFILAIVLVYLVK